MTTRGLVLLALCAGCGTVDLREPPPDVNACRPSEAFFQQQVWPNFLSKDFGGKRCTDSRCHDAASGRPLTLTTPTSAPAIPAPADWAALYRSVTVQLFCTNVGASPLLTYPDGRQTHGGGKLIEPDGAEETLIKMWVTQK